LGSLQLFYDNSDQTTNNAVNASTEETKTDSVPHKHLESEEEMILFYFHSAVLVQQIIFLFFHYNQTNLHSQIVIEDHSKEHRLLMECKKSEIFINATNLISVPEKYLYLEKQLAFYNCLNYKKIFLDTATSVDKNFQQQHPLQNNQIIIDEVPSITYINPEPVAGQKDVEILESNLFPLAGMVVIKAQLTLSSPESFIEGSTSHNDTRNNPKFFKLDEEKQVKTGAWMPCWISIDMTAKTVSFYERGPSQSATFKISCDQSVLNVNDIIDVDDDLEVSIVNARLLLGSDDKKEEETVELINIYFLFKNIEDLWRWTLSLSSLCSVFQWKNNENMQNMKLSKFNFYTNALLNSAGSQQSQLQQLIQLRSILSDGNVLFHLENMIVDREIVRNCIRYISLPGYLIQFIKFFQLNSKIIINSKNFQYSSLPLKDIQAIQSLTEGSLLLSINGLSAVQLPSSTVLKFINEIPKEMSTDMAFIKFSNSEFIVNVVEIDNQGIMPVFGNTSENTSSPTKLMNNNSNIGTNDRVTKKLDAESKLNLNKVIERKKSIVLNQSSMHDINEALQGTHLDNLSLSSSNKNKMTLNQFHLSNFDQIPWVSFRLLIQNGKLMLTPVQRNSDNNNAFYEMNYRFSFHSVQSKVLMHNNKDTNFIHDIKELCLEVFDSRCHLILNCSNFRLFRSLLRSLLLGMKLFGSVSLDLPYIYTQSEKYQIIRTRQTLLQQLENSNSNNKDDLQNHPLLQTDEIQNEQFRKTLTKFSTSGLLQQAMLLAPSAGNNNEGLDSDNEDHNNNRLAITSPSPAAGHPVRRESVIMSLSSVLEDYNDEFRSRSLLQAAEALEETLTALELPLTFPTPSVIDQNLQELRTMNRSNHQLLSDLMTLQVKRFSL
jgi:hypothetical protein